jgi:hypothetical protein
MGFARKISAYYLTALMFVATTNIVLSAHICPNGFYTLFLNESPISCCSNHSPGNETGHSHDHSQSGSLAVSDGNFCCFTKTIETTGVDVVYPSIGIRKIDYKVAVFQLELPLNPFHFPILTGTFLSWCSHSFYDIVPVNRTGNQACL